jgi:AcrR family transcriptional regulator
MSRLTLTKFAALSSMVQTGAMAPTAERVEAPRLSRRDERRRATFAEIKALARQQLAEQGPGGVSLRAIARDLRMASSALYRYYPSVNDLITELIVDAYDSLADTLTAEIDDQPRDDPVAQWRALCHGYRAWALGHRSDFALIFGTPLPGYHAPEQATAAAAGRATGLAVRAYADAVAAGVADPDRSQVPATIEEGELLPTLLAATGADCTPRLAAITLAAYASLLGFLNTEIFGSLTRLVDTNQLYDAHIRAILIGMGFDPALIHVAA